MRRFVVVFLVLYAFCAGSEEWGDRIADVSARFLNTAYGENPLGEGISSSVDPDPRLRLDTMDCVTFIETVYACTFASTGKAGGDTLEMLDRIRYRRGVVSFHTRNHFTASQWVPSNSAWLENITRRIAPSYAYVHRGMVSRRQLYEQCGVSLAPGLSDSLDLSIPVISPDDISTLLDSLHRGDLLLFVKRGRFADVSHLGFVARSGEGEVLLRHASSTYGRVGQEPLVEWLKRNHRTIGVSVLRATAPPPAPGPIERVIGSAFFR
jgi:hypothetical protein